MPFKSVLKIVAFIAVFTSLTLHVLAMAIAPKLSEEVQIQGGEEAVAAALGSNFEDLVKAGDELSPLDAETVEPIEPEVTEQTDAEQLTPATVPQAAPVPITEALKAPESPTATTSLVPIAPAPITDMAMLAPVEPAQTIEAEPDEPVIPVPAARPFRQIDKDRLEKAKAEKNKPKPKVERKETVKKTAAGSKQSNATSNARAGTASGNEKAKSAQSGERSAQKSTKAGNAAASNYPGKVYSKISRTRQRNAGGKGVARVRFQVSSSGKATGISIAGSSGNVRVDKAAIGHIQRASPFPKPPAGAQRQFVIPIEFRR